MYINWSSTRRLGENNMKTSTKLVIAFVILGFLGILAQFTPLKEIQIPTGRTSPKTESLPVVMIAVGFGTAGAIITISFKNKK